MSIALFCLGANISQQLAVSLILLGGWLTASTHQQEKEKPSNRLAFMPAA